MDLAYGYLSASEEIETLKHFFKTNQHISQTELSNQIKDGAKIIDSLRMCIGEDRIGCSF